MIAIKPILIFGLLPLTLFLQGFSSNTSIDLTCDVVSMLSVNVEKNGSYTIVSNNSNIDSDIVVIKEQKEEIYEDYFAFNNNDKITKIIVSQSFT